MKSQSKIISMVHEDVKGLHRIGLMDWSQCVSLMPYACRQ